MPREFRNTGRSGWRGRSAHELAITGWEKTRNRDCLSSTAADVFVRPATIAKLSGSQPNQLNWPPFKSALTPEDRTGVAREAKALVALAFRNGPIENVHAGKACPTCQDDPQYSHITQAEMRQIMKAAVDRLYTFLLLKQRDPKAYDALLSLGERYTTGWDDPVSTKEILRDSDS